ncbi:MAG: GNAT family N-acetyltransferase [Planctomycetaceae bacterium]
MKRNTNDFRVHVVEPSELGPEELRAWREWCGRDAALQGPYFHPEFMRAVAEVRNDVRVGVLEDTAGLAGFFPFQRTGFRTARPVGGRLSDFHGVVARPGWRWSVCELIRRCGLAAWDFTHLPTTQPAFARHCRVVEASPFLDLSRGFDSYVDERRKLGSRSISQTQRKARKLAREVGPLRFERHVDDGRILRTLMDWKSRQYRRSDISDVFSFPWAAALLKRLHATRHRDFGGQLSALSAGDELVALHFGIYSENVLHYWFPAYDPQFDRYSAGLVLLLEMARDSATRGFARIDLGNGTERYKTSLASGAIGVASGSVESDAMVHAVRRCWRHTRSWLKTSPVGAPARMSARLVRPLREWLSFR